MSGGHRQTQAARLVDLAGAADLFHAPDETAYATIVVNGHRETHAVRRSGFRDFLVREFFYAEGKPPSTQALQNAIQLIEARARFDGHVLPVWNRVAQHDDHYYLDLGDSTWQAVEIGPFGWRVVAD